jgi:hypothetical protein
MAVMLDKGAGAWFGGEVRRWVYCTGRREARAMVEVIYFVPGT